MDMKSSLFELSESSCITGGGAAAVALEALRPFAPDVHTDALGSVIAPVVPPVPGGEHLMIDAHLDEIGFVVTSVDGDGFLRVAKAGGPDLRVLLGQEVTVFGREPLFGVFCCRPPHLTSREDYAKAPEMDSLAVDIGFSHEQAAERVSPGDFITLRRKPDTLLNGCVTGKALDNRAGVAAVLRALELLDGETPGIGLTVVFSLSEELGERGAKAAAFYVAPTQALVLDVSFAYTPDAPREKCGDLKKGPMIGVSPVLDDGITQALFRLAREGGIPFQTEAMAGETGTNSDGISIARAGVKTGLASIPLRYMHTAAEVVALEDIENTARLIAAYIRYAGRDRNA